MDSIDTSLQKTCRGFTSSLVSAVHEWMVIFMLFIDAVFSFFITKCAHFWKLRPPCLLCSRLDHIFTNEKKGYLWDLICCHHKKEISSLVFCHTHNKLVDVHGLCENCLFSFATINKSNAETYRLLVGKLGEDPFSRFDDDSSHESQNFGSKSKSQCSCCYELWAPRFPQKLIGAKSIGFEATELDTPVSTPVGLVREDDKKVRDNQLETDRTTHRRNLGIDNLFHIGYRELKIMSDTESEVQFSEEDDYSPLVHDKDENRVELEIKDVPRECRFITLEDDLASEKLINLTSTEEPPHFASLMSLEEPSDLASPILLEEPVILAPQLLVDNTYPLGGESGEFSWPTGHGLEELNWEQPSKTHPPLKTDQISLPDSPDLCTVESKHEYVTTCGDDDGARTVDPNNDVTIATLPSETILQENIPVPNDQNGPLIPNLLELGDAYMLAISDRGRQISSLLAEQWIGKESSKVGEDLRILLSQLSVSRGIEQTKNEVTPSPRFSVTIDDVKTNDGLQVLQKRISLERNESSLSTDGSIVSEIEGESVIDRLKRQIDHDKKLMSSLYKELEEERNASAIAANQAMAMITRLQEEKATLNMEALQYLRMMEEQTEYDNEALQKANDVLAEKEKELQDMEDELEYYRNKYPHESVLENDGEIHDMNAKDIGIVPLDSSQVDCNSSNHENILSRNQSNYENYDLDKDAEDVKDSLSDFECERMYITQRLKKLEKMLHLFSNNGVYVNLDKGKDIFEKEMENFELVENVDKENTQNQERISPMENSQIEKEDIELDHTAQSSPYASRKIEITSFENEIFNLNKRLELIEADKEFLKHAVNSLGNEEMGLQLVQEIASHLRELRKIGVNWSKKRSDYYLRLH